MTVLAPYFTNLDGPVFALVNLPEVVKGALFARYSRSPKSLRRLFLDEFVSPEGVRGAGAEAFDTGRAERLYERVFFEYGDDSVAQLGGVHLACEGASNILTKVLEWGRLMAYLEQSTRYIPYDDRPAGRYRYHVPAELTGGLRERYVATLDRAFDVYREWLPRMRAFFEARHPRDAGESESRLPDDDPGQGARHAPRPAAGRHRRRTSASTAPARPTSSCCCACARTRWPRSATYADLMLVELRKVMPAFLRRVDMPERGGAWSAYLAETQAATARRRARAGDCRRPAARARGTVDERRREVTLTDFDPDGEVKVVAAALYAVTDRPDRELLAIARALTAEQRADVLRAYVGTREATGATGPAARFERTAYRFDVLADYGAFRDLQRHRLLTLEWQRLSPRHGWVMPEAVGEAGGADGWRAVMDAAAELHDAIAAAGLPRSPPTRCAMAYRVRFYMEMNAREAMHVIELRTTPQGHPSYRRVCQAHAPPHRRAGGPPGHRRRDDVRRSLGGRARAAGSRARRRAPPRRALTRGSPPARSLS